MVASGPGSPTPARAPVRRHAAHQQRPSRRRTLLHRGAGAAPSAPPLRRSASHCSGGSPEGTHNSRPWGDGVLCNDINGGRLAPIDRAGQVTVAMPVPAYDPASLVNADLPEDHARQRFNRGLCPLDDDLVAVGSSPANVNLFSAALEGAADHRHPQPRPAQRDPRPRDLAVRLRACERMPETLRSRQKTPMISMGIFSRARLIHKL